MKVQIKQEDIAFPAGDGEIQGWFFSPPDAQQSAYPCIVMAHGYGATRDMGLEAYARRFASAGFGVLVFDYRGTGNSTGAVRQQINPFLQIDDYRDAITYAASRPEIDSDRIGVWGSSFSGGHALVVAATDKRVKCVVSQIPTIDGSEALRRRMSPEYTEKLNKAFAEDRAARLRGKPPVMKTLVSRNPGDKAVYANTEAVDWYLAMGEGSPLWKNEITLQSMELFRAYKPGCYVTDISPCPLLMIVAQDDTVTPSDLALDAFQRAGEPKRLVTIPGGHFEPYVRYFEQSSEPACQWFKQHLLKD